MLTLTMYIAGLQRMSAVAITGAFSTETIQHNSSKGHGKGTYPENMTTKKKKKLKDQLNQMNNVLAYLQESGHQ